MHIALFSVCLVEVETGVEIDGGVSIGARAEVLVEQGAIVGVGTFLYDFFCTLNGRFLWQ